jgi:hypothetical protein
MDQIAKGENVVIDPSGPPPTIQVKIGAAAIGFYSCYLIKGSNHPLICKGRSDQPLKSCPIGSNSSSLPGQNVSWQVGTAADTDPFNIVVTLAQGNTTLKTYTYNGQGDDFLVDYVTLVSE